MGNKNSECKGLRPGVCKTVDDPVDDDLLLDASGAVQTLPGVALPVDEAAIARIYKSDLDTTIQCYHANSGLCPCHEDASMVEYYSPTHKIWLVGELSVSVEKKKKKAANPVIVYNVRVKKSGQLRTRVPLDMIRKPFEPTELVEVFSKRNDGQWLSATIRGPKAGGNIMKGYKVAVESQAGLPEMLLDNVPSWRLRRRFPPRSSIEVYRGVVCGWAKAVVHSVITEFPAEPPMPLGPFSPGTSADMDDTNTARSSFLLGPVADDTTQWMREDAATVCGTTVCGEDTGVHPWFQVPVYVEEWDEEDWDRDPEYERAQWVPSYLIRMRMIHLASSSSYQRRSYIM